MSFGVRRGAAAGEDGGSGLGIKDEVSALKRQRILEEASRLFFEKGYSGSTLEALAGRLEVTKPFIYSYYASKADLLSAICETGITLSLVELEKALRDKYLVAPVESTPAAVAEAEEDATVEKTAVKAGKSKA